MYQMKRVRTLSKLNCRVICKYFCNYKLMFQYNNNITVKKSFI